MSLGVDRIRRLILSLSKDEAEIEVRGSSTPDVPVSAP